MAWEEIKVEEDTTGFTKYPKFEKVGDSIEGNLYEFDKDQWGNKRMVLDCGEDKDGELKLAYLPSHVHLTNFYEKVAIGDYLKVELAKLIPPKEDSDNEYPTRIYKVQVDPDRKQYYEDDEFFDDE